MTQNPVKKTVRGGLVLVVIGVVAIVLLNSAPVFTFAGIVCAFVGTIITAIGAAAWVKQRTLVR
jgi:hypothetical protein